MSSVQYMNIYIYESPTSVEVGIYLKINFGIPNKETGFFSLLLHLRIRGTVGKSVLFT